MIHTLPSKENLAVEFKTSFNEEVIETLVAFSNAKGGTVFVGVSDKGKVQGVTIGKETIPNWINEIKNKTSPQIIPEVEALDIDNKTVISLFVIEYPIKPVSTRGKYYKRVGNSNHLLSVDEIANEHLKTINSSWDFYIDPFHTKDDLSDIDSISFNADLFQEVDDIMAFIKRHLKVEYIITGNPQRTERFDYPLDAIREIVVNMVVHRDYRDSSASIIKIYDNRIEFYNPGKLYGGITVEDLLSGNYLSKSRNKLIAKAFKATGTIERYGSGIMRVRKICMDYGVKEPDFREIANGFQVVLYNERVGDPQNVLENVPNVLENVTEKVTENRVDAILELVKNNNNISMQDMANILDVDRRTIKRDLAKLKAKGLIEHIGVARSGYWKVN